MVCNDPPPPECNGDDIWVYYSPGTCEDGACVSYPHNVTSCDFGCHEAECRIGVLLLSPDFYAPSAPDMSWISNTFASFLDCDTYYFDTGSAVPALSDLEPYDVVMVGNNTPWTEVTADPVSVGNSLADYVDAGGKLVDTNFVHDYYVGDYTWYLEGRYIDDGYGPFHQAVYEATGPLSLSVSQPGHEVMSGVSTLQDSGLLLDLSLRAGASELASYSNGYPAVAISADQQICGINAMFFGDTQIAGDADVLLHNAVQWLAAQ